MATPEQIVELRLLIDEPTDESYTDAVLAVRIEEAPSVRTLASSIWREKAARYAGLVDIKEGNSDRKLSQLYSNALSMASSLALDDSGQVVRKRVTRTRAIERP